MKSVNVNSPVPLYIQAKESIFNYIDENNLSPDTKLPSERDLTEILGVSRITIRKAFEELLHDGIIYQKQGMGSFVSKKKVQQRLMVLTSFADAVIEEGHTPGTVIIDFEVADAPSFVCQEMGYESPQKLLLIRRLRLVDGSPISIATSYLSYELAGKFTKEDLQDHSLYEILRGKCGVKVGRTNTFLEAAVADHYDAELLNTKTGMPMFLMKGTTQTEDSVTFEYFEVLYRGDRLRFSAEAHP